MRKIDSQIPDFDSLGLPPYVSTLPNIKNGLVLVTGPTGSGKSTTLASILNVINETHKGHIITIEDPVEFKHQSKNSVVSQREVGRDTKSFLSALRASLREDPDVILVGELRDLETIQLALTAAETGHLVFGTLHTNSAVKTVERVLGMFPPNEQDSVRRAVSETLLGVISQGLLKTTDGKRCAFHDILINTDACKDYILKGDLDEIEDIMGRSAFDGMQTSNQALLKLVEDGRVEAEDALAQSLKPNELEQALRGRT
jgi:twitching motility protein PilT